MKSPKDKERRLKDKFGVFFRKNVRVYSPFFHLDKYNYISGHRGIDLMFGNYAVHIIYKFN